MDRRRFLAAIGAGAATAGLGGCVSRLATTSGPCQSDGVGPPPDTAPPARGNARMAASDWPTYRHDAARTGRVPPAVAPDPDALELLWTSRPASVGASGYHGTVVAGSRVITGSGGLAAFEPGADTAPRWQFGGGWFEGSVGLAEGIAVDDGTVYVGTYYSSGADGGSTPEYVVPGRLFALDLATGNSRWVYESRSDPLATVPVVSGDTLYLSVRGTLLTLSTDSGCERRRIDLAEQFPEREPGLANPVAVANGLVYAGANERRTGSDAGAVYALDPESGTVEWYTPVDEWTQGSPVVGDGQVYVVAGRDTTYLLAFDAATGEELWRAHAGATLPAVTDDRVFIQVEDTLYGRDAVTGEHLWQFTLDDYVGMISEPAVGDEIVYVDSSVGLRGVDAETGRVRWSFDREGVDFGDPVLANGRLYAGSEAGRLYCFGVPSG